MNKQNLLGLTRNLNLIICLLVFNSEIIFAENHSRVGVITTLTGELATIGTAVLNGVELARAGHKGLADSVEFFIEDDTYDPIQVISAYRKLTKEKKVNLLIVFGVLQAEAIGHLAERDRIPLINISFKATPVVDKKFLIRSLNYTDQYMKVVADYMLRQKIQTLPIVQTESSFSSAMVTGLQNHVNNSKTFDFTEIVMPSENDFKTIILKLKKRPTDYLGLFLFPENLITFLRQARDLKYSPKVLGTDLCETAANLTQDKDLVSGCIYPDNLANAKFRDSYFAKYGNTAQMTFAASAYDMTKLILEILNNKDQFDAEKFMQKLSKIDQRTGMLGNYSYKSTQDFGQFFEYPIYLKEIRGKAGVLLD